MEEDKYNGCFHEVNFTVQNGHRKTSTVPVVQELARQGVTRLPERFIWAKSENPTDGDSHETDPVGQVDIPLINVSKLRGQSTEPDGGARARARELAMLSSGVKDWGLFIITEHGISSCVLNGVKDAVKAFFGLSFDEKKQAVGSYGNIDNMGYGRNFVKSEDQPLDWIDRLTMKAAPLGGDEGLNVWPQNPSNFRQVMGKYLVEARNVLDELLQALAEALSLDRNTFAKYFDPINSEINVRVNYYPPCPRPDLALGITPHTDASSLTLLMQFDTSGGLQVLRDQTWVTLPWPSDALLVNVGDLLEIMSNGRLKSPWHRVVTQLDVERFSIALFYNPPSSTEIEPEPAESQSSDEGVSGFRKVVIGDYLKNFYEVSPTKEKRAIMYAKVT